MINTLNKLAFLLILASCSSNISRKKISIPKDHCRFNLENSEVKSFEDSIKRQHKLLELLKMERCCWTETVKELNQ